MVVEKPVTLYTMEVFCNIDQRSHSTTIPSLRHITKYTSSALAALLPFLLTLFLRSCAGMECALCQEYGDQQHISEIQKEHNRLVLLTDRHPSMYRPQEKYPISWRVLRPLPSAAPSLQTIRC